MLNLLDDNDIIYKYKFGFRERHSTQLANIRLVEKITKAWESDDIAIGVFLVLKQAFDTVPHDILIKKLHAYGIHGNVLKLLEELFMMVYASVQNEFNVEFIWDLCWDHYYLLVR